MMARRLRWVALALACALASTSAPAQTARPVTFVWDVLLDDPGITGEIERDGVVQSCGLLAAPSVLERSCVAVWPTGTGTFRARMASADGSTGDWSDPVALTIAPSASPGTFTVRLAIVPPLITQGQTMASWAASATGAGGSGSATATTASLGNAAAGDLVVVTAGWYLGTFVSVTDSGGHTPIQIGSEAGLGGGSAQYDRRYYFVVTTPTVGLTVTLTTSGTGTYPTIAADRFTGATGWTLDQSAVGNPGNFTTSGSSGSTGTRGTAAQLLVGGVSTSHTGDTTFSPGTNVAWSAGATYGQGSVSVPVAQEYFFATSAGTDAAEWSWTTSAVWAVSVATFSYTDAGSGGAARRRRLIAQ